MGQTTAGKIRLWIVAVMSIAIALVSYRYLFPGAPGGAPPILANRFTHLGALTIHAGFAATALILGPFQFFSGIRRRWPRVHRWSGTAYVACCLSAGVAGFILALGTTAGPLAVAGFGSLAVVWLICTGTAWRLAVARDFVRHERWMMRSFALTLGAVTLRIQLPLSQLAGFSYADAYPVISFLAWVPNLIVAEMLIRFRTSRPLAASLRTPG